MGYETHSPIENKNMKESEYLEKEKLGILEGSKLDADKRLDLALLILKRKQAAQLGNYDVVEGDLHKDQIIQEIQREFFETEKLLERLQMVYYAKRPQEDRGIYGFSFLVAENEENLKKVLEAENTGDEKTFGILMGYPKTAVDAYQTKQVFDYEEELSHDDRERLKQEGVLPFINFMQSKEYWKEELDYIKEIQKLIQEKTPKLYAELIQEKTV